MNIIIFPGNPPAQYYYRLWIEELKEEHPEYKYYYFDYNEPNDNLSAEENLIMMQQNLNAKVDEASNGEETIIIAHSFGAYFLERYYNREKFSCLLIYPFLGRPKWRGKLTLDLAYISSPLFKIKTFQRLFNKSLNILMPATQNILPEELSKGIKTAGIEKLILRNNLRSNIVEQIHNATLFYNLSDTWSPPPTINFISSKMKSVEADCAHDFVLIKSERDIMTILLKEFLQRPQHHQSAKE